MIRNLKHSRKTGDEDYFTRIIEDAILEKVRNGFDPDRVDELVSKAVPELINELGPKLAASMMKDKRSLRAYKRGERGYDRRLQKRWGKALDLYAIMHVLCRELGEKAAHKEWTDLTTSQECTLEALTGLHVTACRVAGEVLTLISHGQARGALARCRTLHETAIIACVIADSATDPDHSDLAERFIDHEIIHLRRDALQFQKDHETLGEEPLDQGYLDELEGRYNEVIAKYGPDFRREYGWAKKFSPDDNLRKLEEKASLSHFRPHYQWASSEVHCGARGLAHNFLEYRGIIVRDAGKTNVGLIDPANMAIGSLLQVTFSLVVGGSPKGADFEALLCMKALEEMRTTCLDAFMDTQLGIDRDEEKILKRIQRKSHKR